MTSVGIDIASNVGGLDRPVLLRKLDRKSDWGHEIDDVSARLEHAVTKVFHGCDDCFSVYSASSDDDLHAIVVGLNSGRQSAIQQIDFLAFTEDELEASGIKLLKTDGDTDCAKANRLHLDAHFKDRIDLQRLCQRAMDSKRPTFRLSKSDAKIIYELVSEKGCGAAALVKSCGC